MNDKFVDIIAHHNAVLSEASKVMRNNVFRNTISKPKNLDFVGESFIPKKISYVQEVSDELEDIADILNPENNKCVLKCKDTACTTNPIGLIVPRKKCKDDEDIRNHYGDIQVVLHDKYNKCIEEGGEGFIRFIDTLATPKERAENYKIPVFNNVFTEFIVDKQVEKVAKDDIIESVNTLADFDFKIKALIKEAEEYIYDYNKKICILYQKDQPLELQESVSLLAESVLAIEEDFINASSLEARKQALLEEVKNAYKVLYTLSTYNPRDIKESSIRAGINVSLIENTFDDIIENVPSKKSEFVVESYDKEALDKIKKALVDKNTRFLNKYKDKALKATCIGVFMDKWFSVRDISKQYNQAESIINTVLDKNKLAKKDVDELEDILKSTNCLSRFYKTGNRDEKDLLPSMKKVKQLVPPPGRILIEVIFVETKHHQVTKSDIKDAIKILEDVSSDINKLKKDLTGSIYKAEVQLMAHGTAGAGKTKKALLIEKILKEKDMMLNNIESLKIQYLLYQLRTMQAQSRKVIVKACRESKDNVKEQMEILESMAPLYEQLEELLSK